MGNWAMGNLAMGNWGKIYKHNNYVFYLTK